MTSIYLIGSLRNPKIPDIANELRSYGWDIFSDWYCASENADDRWLEHEKGRGLSYTEALKAPAAQHVFEFDKFHLDRCDMAILLMPAGKSGHIELGYMAKDKPTFVLFDEEPPRWDVMYNFTKGVYFNISDLIDGIKAEELRIWPYTSVYEKRRKELS